MIEASIRRARAIPRDKAIRKVANQTQSKRPIFAVTWDPRLPNLPRVQGKHHRSMTLSSPLPERGLSRATISSLQEAEKYK